MASQNSKKTLIPAISYSSLSRTWKRVRGRKARLAWGFVFHANFKPSWFFNLLIIHRMKKCPFCAEEIQDDAVICKHCKSNLSAPASAVPAMKSFRLEPQNGDKTKEQTGMAIFLIIVLLVWLVIYIYSSIQKDTKKSQSQTQSVTASEQIPAVIPSAETQKLSAERKKFDSKMGNNAEAAATAKGFLSGFKEIGVTAVTVKLEAPQNAEDYYSAGGDLKTYRSKVTAITVAVFVKSSTWELTPDSLKKDFVTTLVGVRTLYPNATPKVIVTNGTRTVAEGSWNSVSGPKVELK
jgi:hypothetical protein